MRVLFQWNDLKVNRSFFLGKTYVSGKSEIVTYSLNTAQIYRLLLLNDNALLPQRSKVKVKVKSSFKPCSPSGQSLIIPVSVA